MGSTPVMEQRSGWAKLAHNQWAPGTHRQNSTCFGQPNWPATLLFLSPQQPARLPQPLPLSPLPLQHHLHCKTSIITSPPLHFCLHLWHPIDCSATCSYSPTEFNINILKTKCLQGNQFSLIKMKFLIPISFPPTKHLK